MSGARDPKPRRQLAAEVFESLRAAYGTIAPNRPSDPYKTLLGVVLSARSTSAQVAEVLPALLAECPTPAKLGDTPLRRLEDIVRPCGLQKSKAKALKGMGRKLRLDFDGRVPSNREDLESLPGVGRKSANFVLANAFGKHAMTVDTHVARVSFRLGISDSRDPRGVEKALCASLPPESWNEMHFLLIAHGRNVCKSLSPRCDSCRIRRSCRYYRLEGKRVARREG